MGRGMDKKSSRICRKVGIILFWVLVWHLLALWVDNSILLATPLEAVKRFGELVADKEFWRTVASSVSRIGIGFGFGLAAGLMLAVAGSRCAWVEELLQPIITLCKTIPVASFVVLLLIWWGAEYLAVAICFLIVLPNVYISTLEGIHSTDGKLLEMAQVFGMSRYTRFFYIYRPALKPFVYSSLKLSLGMCWKSGVAAEVIGTPDFSIGERLYFSKIHLDTAGVFAWTAVIILLSMGFERLILWLAAKFFAWEPVCKEVAGHRKVLKSDLSRKDGTGISTAEAAPWIHIVNLTKRFGKNVLFQHFNAMYQAGETYYLTSPSGSGKTTLLRMLCGLEQPDAGSIAGSLNCSVMFQEDRLCEEYSAVRNVEMVVGSRERAREALLRLLSADALDKPCSQLSGGMKRRVALVRAMEACSSCVLLDEPFTGLDAATRETVESYIKEKQGDRILLVATHI